MNEIDIHTSRFAKNHLFRGIRGGRKIEDMAKDDAILSKLVSDTDQVVSGAAALAVGVDEALAIAGVHEADGANGEAFLWLSAIYGTLALCCTTCGDI